MELLITLLTITKLFVIGLAVLNLLQHRNLLSKNLGTPITATFAFVLGMSIASILLHVGLLTNSLQIIYLLIWLLSMLSVFLLLFVFRIETLSLFTGNLLQKFVAGAVYFFNIGILIFQPVIAHDARAIWLIKAKALLLGKTAFMEYLQNPSFWYSHTDYPITMPLLYADLLHSLPTYWEPAIGIFSFTCYFLLIIAIYGAIKKFTSANSWVALGISLVMFMTPEYLRQGWAGLSDVPLSLAFLATFLAILVDREKKQFVLPLIIAALGATIKNEGQTFLVLFVLYMGWQLFPQFKTMLKQKMTSTLLPLVIVSFFALLPIALWKLQLWKLQISNDVASALNFSDIFTRIPTLFNEILPRLFDGYRFGILFIPAIFLLALPVSSKIRHPAVFILVGQALVYIVIYLTTPHDIVWHISTSFSRLLLHLLPSVFLLAITHRSTKVSYNHL